MWRLGLTMAGTSLAVLPLWQGLWSAALVAGICGSLVAGAWAWGTNSARAVGVGAGAGLIALLAGVFAVSQWPRGMIAAPWPDWFAGWLVVDGGCVAALVVDRCIHAVGGRHGSGMAPSLVPVWRWLGSLAALATVLVVGCCGFAAIAGDGDGALRFAVRAGEVLPLPSTLRLLSADHCAGVGSSGNCTAEFVVTAAEGANRATTALRLVGHLRTLGWPLQRDNATYRGCRGVGGILPWTSHCCWLYVDADPPTLRPPAHPETVVVYIDNA